MQSSWETPNLLQLSVSQQTHGPAKPAPAVGLGEKNLQSNEQGGTTSDANKFPQTTEAGSGSTARGGTSDVPAASV